MMIVLACAGLTGILVAIIARFIGAYRDLIQISRLSGVFGCISCLLVYLLAGLFMPLVEQFGWVVILLPLIVCAFVCGFAAIVLLIVLLVEFVSSRITRGVDYLANRAREFVDNRRQRRQETTGEDN
jgi:MFS family permease